MSDPATTYGSYLHLDELLSLQRPVTDEHDEHLFIVIHQVHELWFKETLWELEHAIRLLDGDDGPRAAHTLGRVRHIVKVLVSQIDVLETMTPLEFLTFRDRLETASGFQSRQFRDLEALLGQRDDTPPGGRLWEALVGHLVRATGTPPPTDVASLRALLVTVYRSEPALGALCERFVDLDEGLQEWRYRHLKMVQRTIGTRGGTGGSDGSEYLATTIRAAFPDLWAIRTEL